MRSGPRLRTRLWLGALAFAGVAFAHGLTFLLVAPETHARERLLTSTGHGYWPYVMPLALAALVAALSGFVAGRRAAAPADRLYSVTALRLAILQSAGFVLLEAAERVTAHGSLRSLVSEPFLLIGVLVQVALALAGALLLVLMARVVEHLSGRRRPTMRPKKATLPRAALRIRAPRLRVASGGATLRGPPLAA
jgi:cytochrome bd-type quinol oxidase subunit 2